MVVNFHIVHRGLLLFGGIRDLKPNIAGDTTDEHIMQMIKAFPSIILHVGCSFDMHVASKRKSIVNVIYMINEKRDLRSLISSLNVSS